MSTVLKPFIELPYGAKFRYQGSQEVWVRTQHNVIAAWNGLLANPTFQSLCCFCHLEGDEDGNTLQTLVEVVEEQPAEQHQGEPVAWRGINELGEIVTEWIDGSPPDRMVDLCGNPDSFAKIELAYTHADPAEVEKLRDALDECDGERWKLRTERDTLRAELAELRRWEATVRENSPLLAEVERLRAELGELWRATKLLMQVTPRNKGSLADKAEAGAIIEGLLASAEPSAAVELDADAVRQQHYDEFMQRREARAALERKP